MQYDDNLPSSRNITLIHNSSEQPAATFKYFSSGSERMELCFIKENYLQIHSITATVSSKCS